MVYWKRSWPSQDCPELSRYYSHQAEIVTRARYFTGRCTKTTGHDRFQYTIMLLMIRAARFVQHMSVLSPELSRYHANDAEIVTRSPTKTWSFTQKCTKTTGHDGWSGPLRRRSARQAELPLHRQSATAQILAALPHQLSCRLDSQELNKTLTTVNCLRVVHAMFANDAIVTGGRRCSCSRSANRGGPFQEGTQVG